MISFYPVLCQYLRDHNISYKELAEVTNVNIFTLHLKMLGLKRWKLTEVLRICCFFRTNDAEHLFSKRLCCVRSRTL